MTKDSQVNIRFDEATAAQLSSTAKTLGVSVSQLVRHLTKTFLQEVKSSGAVKLAPEWTRMLGVADARSEWGERKISPDSVMLNEEIGGTMPAQKQVQYPANQRTTKPKK